MVAFVAGIESPAAGMLVTEDKLVTLIVSPLCWLLGWTSRRGSPHDSPVLQVELRLLRLMSDVKMRVMWMRVM